ncbi:MAG: M48 family metallopeptidase [Treponema sp.]|jgi:Zn-dependent protease with chaperone function|nr:M48 family metallopeptidase [Treponema sp.]
MQETSIKRYLVLVFLGVLIISGVTPQSLGGRIMYVAIKTMSLKSSTDFFASNQGDLSYGDQVAVLQERGKWLEVRSIAQAPISGWTVSTNVTAKRIIPGDTTSASAREIALAGKGFNAAVENTYKAKGRFNYADVDLVESLGVSEEDLSAFIVEGHLAKGDAYMFISASTGEISPEAAYYMGRAVGATILVTYKIDTEAPQLTSYLNKICNTIAINSSKPDIYNGYHVAILDSPEINAFATSGGHIFITRGLLECANSEDTLAAVIAHELAHLQLRHSMELIEMNRLTQSLQEIAEAAAKSAAAAAKVQDLTLTFDKSVRNIVDTMVMTGYSQEQEFEADTTALSLLASAGYEPSSLIDMLTVLEQNQASHPGGFNKTHPAPALRISHTKWTATRYSVPDTRAFRRDRFRAAQE